MKVLIYSYPLIGQNVGGLQMQIENTVNRLRDKHVQVDFFDIWITKIKDYDIIHIFAVANYSCEDIVRKAKLLGVKIIISTVYNTNKSKYILRCLRKTSAIVLNFYPLYRKINCCLENADRIITLSSEESRILDFIFRFDTKIEIIPNGIEDEFFNADDRFAKKYGYDKFVLSVGRIERNKNQLSLIKSCKGMGLDIVIIGEISDWDYYSECKRYADDKVHFIGSIYEKEMLASAYRCASLFVLPSYQEVYPISVLEAAVNGCPIVLTKNHKMGNKINDYIVDLVDPNSTTNISSKVKELSKKGKQDINKKSFYTWGNIADEILNIYKDVLSEKNT